MSRREAKGFCFTINNPTEEDIEAVECLKKDDHIREVVAGIERGDRTNTRHVQGFVNFFRKTPTTELQNKIRRAHIRPVRNPRAARRYCKKGNSILVDCTKEENPLDDIIKNNNRYIKRGDNKVT